MPWRVEFSETARRNLKALDRQVARRLVAFLEQRVAPDPRAIGEPLAGGLAGLWKYRVGDYRLVAEILDGRLVVQVVRVGHRREVYR